MILRGGGLFAGANFFHLVCGDTFFSLGMGGHRETNANLVSKKLLLCRGRQPPVKPGEPCFPLCNDANHLGSYAREKPGKFSIFFNIQ